MANDIVTNGHDAMEGAFPAPTSDHAIFVVGGQELRIGPLTLWDLEQIKADFHAIGTNDLIDQATHIIRIVAYKRAAEDAPTEVVDALAQEMKHRCSLKEYRELPAAFNRLLEISGWEFPPTEPDAARAEESLGTGMSTESPPN